MKEEILKELKQLEQEHSITVLYAVESGSRAWGFASKNSDWDVLFIYVHRPEWYLQIDEPKDSIEKILPNDIDLSGWELKKTLRLFRKSNPPLFEWLSSPIVYLEEYALAHELRALSGRLLQPKACLHHYLHMAEGNFKNYLQHDLVRVKKYLYVLRPLLACEWIYTQHSMPPMEFQVLLEKFIPHGTVRTEIEALLSRKKAGEELKEEAPIPCIHEYLEEKLRFYTFHVKSLVTEEHDPTETLNNLFQKTLKEVWQ